MWYNQIINKNDGLSSLLHLFSTEDAFIQHFISNVEFFSFEVVENQMIQLQKRISDGDKIPVRFSLKSKENFHFENENNLKGESKRSFKNRKDAMLFSQSVDLIHNETELRVLIDKDGNYYVRKEIHNASGYRVSQGAISDIHNYMISHIWANTDNPLYFSSLWNITLIPHYMSFILDKPDGNGELIKRIKNLMKAICYILYNPSTLLTGLNMKDDEFKDQIEYAQNLIDEGFVTFIEVKKEISDVMVDPKDIIDKLLACEKNKQFALTLLDELNSAGIDFISQFTNGDRVKLICKMSYPLLVDVTGDDDKTIKQKSRPVNSDVYYANTFFESNNRKYLICNDWKIYNKRLILDWIEGTTNTAE